MHGDYIPDYVLAEIEETPNTGEHMVRPRRFWQPSEPEMENTSVTNRRRRSCSVETIILQPGGAQPTVNGGPTASQEEVGVEAGTEESGVDRSSLSRQRPSTGEINRSGDREGENGQQEVVHKKVDPTSLTRMIVEGLDNKLKESLRPIEIQCGELIQGLGMIGKDVIQLTTDIKLQKIKTDSVLSNPNTPGIRSKKTKRRKTKENVPTQTLGNMGASVSLESTPVAMASAGASNNRDSSSSGRVGLGGVSAATSRLESQNGMLRSLLHRATSLGKNRKAKMAQLQSQMATTAGDRQDTDKERERGAQNSGTPNRRVLLPRTTMAQNEGQDIQRATRGKSLGHLKTQKTAETKKKVK